MTDIMTVKQLPIIEERLQQMKDEIQLKVDAALALEVSEDSVKEIKKVRTGLNTDFKELEDKRKQVKNAVMEPYNRFEAIYKDCVTNLFKPADLKLSNRISEIENIKKQEKYQKVKSYFDEYAASLGIGFVDIHRLALNVTLSASEKSMKASCKEFLDRIYADINAIDAMENRNEIMAEYKMSLDFARAVSTVQDRHKRVAQEKAIHVSKTGQVEIPIEPPKEKPLSAPVVEPEPPKLYSMQFAVRGTLEQLKELKQFMEQKGLEFDGTN